MIRAWVLPLIVFAITVPIVAGFLIAGPGLGLAAGALVGAILLIVVARMRRTRIEVAAAADHRFRLLVVALVAIEEPARAAVAQSATASAEVLVLAPAFNSGLAHWADDLRKARDQAQSRLVLSLGTLAAAGIDARGRSAMPTLCRRWRILSASSPPTRRSSWPSRWRAGERARTLAELRARLDLPLRLVEA